MRVQDTDGLVGVALTFGHSTAVKVFQAERGLTWRGWQLAALPAGGGQRHTTRFAIGKIEMSFYAHVDKILTMRKDECDERAGVTQRQKKPISDSIKDHGQIAKWAGGGKELRNQSTVSRDDADEKKGLVAKIDTFGAE